MLANGLSESWRYTLAMSDWNHRYWPVSLVGSSEKTLVLLLPVFGIVTTTAVGLSGDLLSSLKLLRELLDLGFVVFALRNDGLVSLELLVGLLLYVSSGTEVR